MERPGPETHRVVGRETGLGGSLGDRRLGRLVVEVGGVEREARDAGAAAR
jgi:hypothetical protein